MTARSRRWWQPWAAVAGFASLLHFCWEMLQAPLYRGMTSTPHWEAIVQCAQATLGDVAIALAAYAATVPLWGGRWWLGGASRRCWLSLLGAGLALTIGFEVVNVYVRHRWAYGPAMPIVLGIGLTPLLQWTLLPPLTVWLARRHLLGAEMILTKPWG